MVVLETERKLPKAAIEPLLELCLKISKEIGKSACEIFKEYLELMNKYADYFFCELWPERLDKHFELSDADVDFIKNARSYKEECERFVVVCLRRNLSTEGFDVQGFEEDFKFYGNRECWDCVVPDAVYLREQIQRIEQAVRKFEEEAKQENPSSIAMDMCEYYRRPDVVRRNRIMRVELRLYDDMGGAEGKSCEVKNKYRCPYGKESEQLIEQGDTAKLVWREIKWYDHHWSPSPTIGQLAKDMKWYHYGEPDVIDVTSYDDVLRAIDDGRLERIMEEHKRYMKETGYEAWAL